MAASRGDIDSTNVAPGEKAEISFTVAATEVPRRMSPGIQNQRKRFRSNAVYL